jgi:hypothetical protein
MKLTRKTQHHLPPLRTTQEMADEFGVTVAQLTSALAKDTARAPKSVHTYKGGGKSAYSSRTYWVPGPLRVWWRARAY